MPTNTIVNSNSNIRTIVGHPYAGHTFVCNDIIGIADVEEVFDSALHAISVGNCVCSGYTRMVNNGAWLREQPVLGVVDQVAQFPRLWSSPHVFELHPHYNKYALVVTARLQGDGEYTTTNQTTGMGGEASWWAVQLVGKNFSGAATIQLLNRFYQNQNYHNTIPVGLRQAATPQDVAWAQILPEQKMKQITITGTIDPSLFVNAVNANVGAINFSLDYPVHPLGNAWTAGVLNNGTATYVAPAPHPLSGIDMYCDGIIDFELYLYR